MITNIDYNGQFNLEVVSRLRDKLNNLGKGSDFYFDYEIYNDSCVVLDIAILGVLISGDLDKIDEKFKITIAIELMERILETPLYNIEDSEFNKDYMVKLLHKLERRLLET